MTTTAKLWNPSSLPRRLSSSTSTARLCRPVTISDKYIKKTYGTNDIKIELIGLCTDICVVSNALLLKANFLDAEISKIVKYSVRFQGLDDAPVRVIDDPELFSVVDDILKESAGKNTAYEMFVKSGVFRLLGMLYRMELLSDSERVFNTKEVQKILPILAYINANYYENITLEDASARLNFDSSYFCRLFKSATGATFTEYLNFVRVCKAEKLLSKTQDSILEISEAVGFSSVSYFHRIFKKYRNCSPRYYRSAKYVAISKGERELEAK